MTTRRDFLRHAALAGALPAIHTLSSSTGAAAQADDQPITEYGLPPLPYRAEALEPHIDGRSMRIHHAKHHAGYARGLNKILKKLQEARERNDFGAIQPLSRALAFHAGGYVNHIVFFKSMAPVGRGGGGEPAGKLAERIAADFGSFEKFKAQFSAAAATVEGNGWGVLGYHATLKRLLVTQMMNNENLNPIGLVPLLMVDVWEHAYYLQYQNRRDDYINAWWKVVDWGEVARRFAIATA